MFGRKILELTKYYEKKFFGEGKECCGPLLRNEDGKWRKNCEFEETSVF